VRPARKSFDAVCGVCFKQGLHFAEIAARANGHLRKNQYTYLGDSTLPMTNTASPADTLPGNFLILEILNRYVPEVLQTMAGMTAVPGPGQPNAPQPATLTGVTGSIGLSGKVHGVVYTAFAEELAQLVAEKILGGPASSQDVSDVVAELTNMITGNLKSQLCDRGHNCSLSIPSVVRGEHISVSAKTASISIRNDYHFEGCPEPLVLQIFAVLEK